VTRAVPAWEQQARRSRRWVGDHAGDLIAHVAWFLAVNLVAVVFVEAAAPTTPADASTSIDTVAGVLALVGLVVSWTVLTVLHESLHAVAMHSRGVRSHVYIGWLTAVGYRLPVAMGGSARPRGDGYARLLPSDQIVVALAPAWLSAGLSVGVVGVAVALGTSTVTTACLVAAVWLFGGPSPSDYAVIVDAVLWPDEIREQRQQQAARIREHAAAEGADPRVLAPDRHHTTMSYVTTPTAGASPAKQPIPDGGERE